jgi:hypothetical protein
MVGQIASRCHGNSSPVTAELDLWVDRETVSHLVFMYDGSKIGWQPILLSATLT